MSLPEKAISYDTGQAIKGIALLLMVFHHCFGFPAWYFALPPCMHNRHLVSIAGHAAICVSLFAFLTGWFYYHHQEKSIQYSCKKIIGLLTNYWIICIPLLAIATIFFEYNLARTQTFFELIPIKDRELMFFSWYVWFYILAMCLLPLLGILEKDDHKTIRYVSFILILSGILWILRHTDLSRFTYSLPLYFPIILAGYFTAEFRIFERFLHFSKRKYIRYPLLFILSITIIEALKLTGTPCRGTLAKGVAAGSIILSILILKPIMTKLKIWNILRFLGYYSLNIWFIHCLFFARPTREFFQTHFFLSENPLLIMGCVLIFSLALALTFDPLQKYVSVPLLAKLFPSRRDGEPLQPSPKSSELTNKKKHIVP